MDEFASQVGVVDRGVTVPLSATPVATGFVWFVGPAVWQSFYMQAFERSLDAARLFWVRQHQPSSN